MKEFYFTKHRLELVRISGRDAAAFLQGMVTNDVVGIQNGEGTYAFQLDPTGHVLADMTIIKTGNGLEMLVEPGVGETLSARLEQYRIMERCRIEWGGAMDALTVWGSDSQQWAATIDPCLGPDATEGTHAVVSDVSEDNHLVRMPLSLGPAFRWWLAGADHGEAERMLANAGAVERSQSCWNFTRIRAGLPVFGIDFDSRTLAPETAQESRAIHYRKGCYVGQEIVARIDARGRVRRTLCQFALSDVVPAGTELFRDNDSVGWITSAAMDPESNFVHALGYVRQESRDSGARFRCDGHVAHLLNSIASDGDVG